MDTLPVLCVSFVLLGVNGFNFNEADVKLIRLNKDNAYFGYSVLLQKGREPAVIVGAPGKNSSGTGGTLHRCSLNGKCSDYILPDEVQKPPFGFTGNMLGSALDGGDNAGETLLVCSPRVIDVNGDFYLKGYCYYKRNSSSLVSSDIIRLNPFETKSYAYLSKYYDYAFGEAGFDAHYVQAEDKVLLGSPGVKNWNGIMVALPLAAPKQFNEIPQRQLASASEYFSYLGYKVTSATFESTRKKHWYLASAPRGLQLVGDVKIYKSNGAPETSMRGFEMGSYFGASILAVDVNNDRVDDLLIGAPMGKGSTWDEGYVYFYKSYRSKFENPVILTGLKKPGARFGTCISSLGDIDLDYYNDVAIAAPYEDDGVGAVYIYKGHPSGISVVYSQRLSPERFSPGVGSVRGFGQGLSRGVDIDGNGHNDLAIGAYLSDHVFIVKSLSIVDYRMTLIPNVTSITSDVINLQHCIYYTQRSEAKDIKTLDFKIDLILDYRTVGPKIITKNSTVFLARTYCNNYNIKVMQSPTDISDFKIYLKVQVQQKNLIANGETKIDRAIAYSHGCGTDNICQTKITVLASTNLQNIVLGADKEMNVHISAENAGEPGYNCVLNLEFPEVLELRTIKDCRLNNASYECPFSSRFLDKKESDLIFDIKLKEPKLGDINVTFQVTCLGDNLPAGANTYNLSLNVLLENSPHMQGTALPTSVYFDVDNSENQNDEDKDTEASQVSHAFNIGNSGPSPIKLGVFILLPKVEKDGTDIFVAEARGSTSGIEIQCNPIDNDNVLEEESLQTEIASEKPGNRSQENVVIGCLQPGIECLKLFCDGEYLYKSTEVAEITVKVKVNAKLLAKEYREEIESGAILSYVSTAYLYNSAKTRVVSQAATKMFVSYKKPVPLWIYVIGSIIGVLLLALLVFILYKCHFFDRNYKEKLKEEKLMEQQIEDVDPHECGKEDDAIDDNC